MDSWICEGMEFPLCGQKDAKESEKDSCRCGKKMLGVEKIFL